MTEQNASRLKFKEFNYDDAKRHLPEGYEPIPYLPVMANVKRHAQVCIHGLSSEEAAIQFIAKYKSLFPPSSFIIQKALQNAIQYEYQVIAPYELTYFMDETMTVYPTVVVKSTPYNEAAVPQVLYRTIGSANVKKLFERGELLLSTFKRCRALENDARRDKYELRNIVEIHERDKRMEVDIGFDDSLLVLCTSLPPVEDTTGCSDMIKITDVAGFFKEITKTLVEMGFSVAEVLYGPCVYNDKVVAIETDTFISTFETKVQNTKAFPGAELAEFIKAHVENDIIMNKPSDFMREREYRFVWKLVSSFNEEKLLITNPNLAKFCEEMD